MLEEQARQIRRDILEMIFEAKSGHPGGSLGAAEILSVLYFDVMRHNPKDPFDPDRDRFVLSNGHLCAAHYSVLARSGYFDLSELHTFRKLNSRLQGHPSRIDLPGVETSSGPLGQGLSIANGMALAAKLDKRAYRVYCLVGDGELQEGQIWEAAMTSRHYALDNLVLIVSLNGLQIDGHIDDVKSTSPVEAKFEGFGWQVLTVDGHSIPELREAFQKASEVKGRPTVLVARTVMGKGVSYMENKAVWHGLVPTAEQMAIARQELG